MSKPSLFSHLLGRTAPANATRSLDAATGSRRAPSHFGRINPEVGAAGETVAQRARYLVRNNAYLNNALGNAVGSIIGTGMRPVPAGLTGDERAPIVAAFDTWARSADAAGLLDFWGLQALAVDHALVDGEALALLHRDPDGLRVQLLEPSQLDRSKSGDLSNGNTIVQGVEVDPRGRRVAFWIIPENPNGAWTSWAASERVLAENVIHMFKPVAAGQVRGLSALAPAVMPANELDQLMDAALVQTKVHALLSAFLVNQNDLESSGPLGDDQDLSLEPGVVRTLPSGWDVKFLSPEGSKDFPQTARLYLQQLSAALGMPEHLVSGDLTQANYSSLRAGLLPWRQKVEQFQYHILVPQFLARVWREWLLLEVLAGRLDAPAETSAEWIAPKVPQVDPVKDLEAVEKALRMGLTSRSQAVAEMGWSVDALDAEIAADNERATQLGLALNAGESND